MKDKTIQKKQYSDGDDVENTLLDIYKHDDPQEQIDQILSVPNHTFKEVAIDYHTNSQRQNILNWYDFRNESSLLEVGPGAGAITGLFCEKLDAVTAVEISKRRSEILNARHGHNTNLEVLAMNIQDFSKKGAFDYVTSIGVLEYSGAFIEANNPYLEFIKLLKSFLRKDGELIIAIENRFGLKYWAGAGEEHNNKRFFGLEGYPENDSVKTFGKSELQNLLLSTGFNEINFYYPSPDYKFPVEVFSDEMLPSTQTNLNYGVYPSPHHTDREYLFNENRVMAGIVENNKFDFFSNSFLVFAK